MNEPRRLIGWLLLGLLTAVGVGGAILGIALAPDNLPLGEAATNTLAASNYTEVATERTAQGSQTDYLVYQAPDRLGGYIQSGTQRTYIYIIGSVQYQSVSVAANASTKHLVFYRQAAQPVTVDDPAHNYLRFANQAKHVTKDGSTYTFVLHQQKQTGTFVYTVNGRYISSFMLTVQNASVNLVISQVGTSPAVKLPAGSKVVGLPAAAGGTGGAG
jgi:hypothetical protein